VQFVVHDGRGRVIDGDFARGTRRARFRGTLVRAFEFRTIRGVEVRTDVIVLRLREGPRRVAFVNVRELFAKDHAHLFRRARERRVGTDDVVVQGFQRDRCDFDIARFRVGLRHFVHSFFVVRHCIDNHHNNVIVLRRNNER